MKKSNYQQPKLLLLQICAKDVVTASVTYLGDDDFGREDIFDDIGQGDVFA